MPSKLELEQRYNKVAMLLASGFTPAEIASQLSLSISQVKNAASKRQSLIAAQHKRSLSAISRAEEELIITSRQSLIEKLPRAAERILDLLETDDAKVVLSAAQFLLTNVAGFTPKTAEKAYDLPSSDSTEKVSLETVERLASLVASLRDPVPHPPIPATIDNSIRTTCEIIEEGDNNPNDHSN